MRSHLNLFPLAYRRRQLVALRLRQWSAMWALAVAVTAVLGWTQWSTFHAGMLRLGSLRKEYEPVKATRDRVERFEQIIDDLQKRESLVLELADEKPMFDLLGLLSRAADACDGQVSIQDLAVQRGAAERGGKQVLTLNGLAVNNQAVASFVDELRKVGFFKRVELRNTGMTALNNIESRTYSLECTF